MRIAKMITKRNCTRLGKVALAVLMLSGCESTPTVHTNLDPGANLASYKTFTFAPQPGTNRGGYSTPLTAYFETAVTREMEAHGYRKSDDDADLLVDFNANARENVDIRSSPGSAVGYYGYRAGLYAGAGDVETVRYKVGTANVDVVDARKKKLLWEGIAEGRLTDEVMKSPQTAVDSAVAQMFMQFPARAAP